MRILYAISYPMGLAGEFGGVLRYMNTYMEMARQGGAQVELLSPWNKIDPAKYDLVHFAPADLSLLSLAKEFYKRRIPFVVSPIIDKNFSNYTIRTLIYIDILIGRLFYTNLGAARRICQLSSGVCLMSKHEQERVQRGLGVTSVPTRVILTSPVTMTHLSNENSDLFREKFNQYNDFILFVGDLSNPRKNVLRLIGACNANKLPLILIGTLNETSYGLKVKKVLEKSKLTRWIGNVSRTMLFSAMKSCRVFALPSLVEGVGIAALEAGYLGSKVVITKNGGTKDYFGDCAWYVDPKSTKSISAIFLQAWHASNNLGLQEYIKINLTPKILALSLMNFYKTAITK